MDSVVIGLVVAGLVVMGSVVVGAIVVGAIVVGALLRTLRETRTAPTGCVGNYHNPMEMIGHNNPFIQTNIGITLA